MALLKNLDIITNKMVADKLPFYKVYDGDAKSKELIDCQEDKNITPEEAAQKLRAVVESVSGLVTIQIQGKTGKDINAGGDNRVFKYQYRNGGEDLGSTGSRNNFYPGGTHLDLIFKLMDQKHEKDLEAMKMQFDTANKIKELEAKINGTGDEHFWVKEGFARFDRMFPAKTPPKQIHGHPDAPAKNLPPQQSRIMNDEQQKKLNAAIHELLKQDPNFVDNLVHLATIAKEKPLVYAAAITELKKL